jgi:hypothetical protein
VVTQVRNDASGFKGDLEHSRKQLQQAQSLQPQMNDIRQQLEQALAQIRNQQTIISSSEEFVKNVLGSHRTDLFSVGHELKTRLVTMEPPKAGDRAVVLFLLSNPPIKETLQLQYRVFAQPPNSFVTLHNLVVFFWGEPLSNLLNQQLSASYFPDKSDKELSGSLGERDGRVYADNEPLPYFNKPDPEFKGNKWMEVRDGHAIPKYLSVWLSSASPSVAAVPRPCWCGGIQIVNNAASLFGWMEPDTS